MIVVLGGGPAGLAAATVLARAGRAVTVHEAGTYPRHRVCGEFLSPDAGPVLASIGIDDLPERLGAPTISSVRVTSSRGGRRLAESGFKLDAPGWGVSRFDFDRALAEHARRTGVEVRERSRVGAPAGFAESGGSPGGTEALIVATGRGVRTADDARATDAGNWVGVKVHVRDVAIPGVTELHCIDGAYAGMNEVSCDGERVVNVCALVRMHAWDRAGRTPGGLWRMFAAESPAFAARWAVARPVEGSEAAVAGFGFHARGAVTGGRAIVVGDAAALTAPVSGAGQAAALASGVAAAGVVLDEGERAVRVWESRFRAQFHRRLAVGGLLQRVMLTPSAASIAIRMIGASGRASSWLYRATRGGW
ncbi:MAG: FAD-dependent monooxygenase [Planctomycetes bacterium]|nr:FAD-dependent monooxygenase [Planctomycetota bacterium]